MVSKIAAEAASPEKDGLSASQGSETGSVLEESTAETLVHMVKAMGPVINQEEEKHLEQVLVLSKLKSSSITHSVHSKKPKIEKREQFGGMHKGRPLKIRTF